LHNCYFYYFLNFENEILDFEAVGPIIGFVGERFSGESMSDYIGFILELVIFGEMSFYR